MKYRILCALAVFAFVIAATPAQTKVTWTIHCGQADVHQSVAAAQHNGVPFTVSQGTCTVTGDVNGVAPKELVNAVYSESSATQQKNWGVSTETFANGDQIYYGIQTTAPVRNGALGAGQKSYQIVAGTGGLKTISGSGNCTVVYNSAGGSDSTCTGTYTIP
jgi:hypothetical protein